MEFELNDEQIMFQDSVRRWAEKGYGFDTQQTIERSTAGFSPENGARSRNWAGCWRACRRQPAGSVPRPSRRR